MAIYKIECDALIYRAICNTLYCVWQSERKIGEDFRITCKKGGSFWNNIVFTAPELKPASVSSRTFPF